MESALKKRSKFLSRLYIVDQKNDDPQQFRAIGWCGDRLASVIFEIRHDDDGEFYHLITAWKTSQSEEQSYAENT